MLLVYVIVAAVPMAYLLGRRLGNYLNRPLRAPVLPVAAFLIEASFALMVKLAWPSELWLPIAVCMEYALLAAFLYLNRRRRGVGVLGLATALNFLVISANGFRMPVTPLIYESARYQGLVERIRSGALPEYVLVDWDAPLWFLGDTIPLFGGLASAGDLLMAAGLMVLIVHLLRAAPPEGEAGD